MGYIINNGIPYSGGKIVDFGTTEEKTNETRYGLPVYQKIVDVPMGTGGTSAQEVAHGIPISSDYFWIDIGNSYIAGDSEWHYPLTNVKYGISAYISPEYVRVHSNDDWTGWTAHVVVKYCKNE